MTGTARIKQGLVILVFFWLALTAVGIGTAVAADIEAEERLAFARHLVRQGEPALAVAEFHRFLYHHPDHLQAPQARLDLARAYLSLGRPGQAAEVIRRAEKWVDPVVRGQAVLILARAELDSGLPRNAESLLNNLINSAGVPQVITDQALYDLGWLMLGERRYEEAESVWNRVDPAGPLGIRAAFLAKEAERGPAASAKSPITAAVLSALVPGLGQLYLNRLSDAAWSFSLSLGPAALAWLAFGSGAWVTAGIAAAAALAFYGGSIYHAINETHRLDRRAGQEFIERLKKRAASLPGP